jgi:2,4-dienoyl-CoA reductase-like NADH-dependent reductase (Old Yellow Enzyme family)
MKKHGVDLVDCSSGGIVPDVKLPEKEGYNVFISEVVKKTGIMTSVVGYIFNEKFTNSIIERGETDFVTIGRLLLRDPYWPARKGFQYGYRFYPVQYERGFNVPGNLYE